MGDSVAFAEPMEPAGPSPVQRRLHAGELLATVLDEGSWHSWDLAPEQPADPGSEYAAELADAAERSGCDEAVITGSGRIHGRPVAIIAGEFRFLAGSIGAAAAERIVLAFERARRERLPLLAAPSSGGTRMQEGTPAFVGMVKITAACVAFKQASLPYLVYLRHPTTGGVFASWGSLGHVTVAEPGATIGFLGARVYEALFDRPFPADVQTAENLFTHGIIDAVLPLEALAQTASRALDVLSDPRPSDPRLGGPDEPGESDLAPEDGASAALAQEPVPDLPAWESIQRSRRPDRPGVRALLRLGASDVLPLHGTGQGEQDRGMLLALARFGSAPCVVLGQDRRGQLLDPLSAGGLRMAQRGMRLAADLQLPLVTVIDTAGADLSREAEERGMAGEIARCLAELVMLDAPTLSILLGEGTGGAALALLPTDRVVCAQHSWLSPLPPEGASAIVYRSTDRAAEIAASQRIRSLDLLADGVVDRVVVEHPDAADDPADFCRRMSETIQHELTHLAGRDDGDRLQARLARYRSLAR